MKSIRVALEKRLHQLTDEVIIIINIRWIFGVSTY